MEKLVDRQIRMFLKKITKSDDEYYEIITRLALTFGLRFSQISQIFKIPEAEVGSTLRKSLFAKAKNNKRPYLVSALDNLSAYAFKDYNRTANEFYDFINNLYMAYVNKDKENILKLRGMVNDIPVARFRQNHQTGEPITPEDALALIHYQIKFFLSPVALCKFCKITNEEYQNCLNMAKELDPNIVSDYAEILKIYQVAENHKSNNNKYTDAASKMLINISPQENKEVPFQRG